VLLDWWCAQNSKRRHIWPGLDVTKVGEKWKPQETVAQIRAARHLQSADGHIFWDMKNLTSKTTLEQALESAVYTQPALVPASSWMGGTTPLSPSLTASAEKNGTLRLDWKPGANKVWLWVLQTRTGEQWTMQVLPGTETGRAIRGNPPEVLALTGVDRFGNASQPVVVESR
jgi:hypothetical protein